MSEFVPDRGDVIWLEFDPQAGHEQGGRRPALVLSPRAYNALSSRAFVCPITRTVKGYPFEISIPADTQHVSGVILADQLKSADWRARRGTLLDQLPNEVVALTVATLSRLLT